MKQPQEVKRIANEDFELIGGNPHNGFATKAKAQQLAREWLVYPKDGHARVIQWNGRWWVYGN